MKHEHSYAITVEWIGNRGPGTSSLDAYSRDHEVRCPGKATLMGSSDPAFRGDRSRYNPEDLLVASLSACHMLWYLSLCAVKQIVVTSYLDEATGTLVEQADGTGKMSLVLLRPVVHLAQGFDVHRAFELHADAHRMCFIANSVNFPVLHSPVIKSI